MAMPAMPTKVKVLTIENFMVVAVFPSSALIFQVDDDDDDDGCDESRCVPGRTQPRCLTKSVMPKARDGG